MIRILPIIGFALATWPAQAAAIDTPWCDSAFPEDCIDDVLAVELDGGEGYTDRVSGSTLGSAYEARITLDVRSDGIQGWSFGMYSDEDFLDVVGPAPAADVLALLAPGGSFEVTVKSPEDGLVQAIVLAFTTPVTLPLGLGHRLVDLVYEVVAEPGAGSLIGPSDELKSCGSCPPAATIITINGESTTPRKVRAALVTD